MAKTCTFNLPTGKLESELVKITRESLYGDTITRVVDAQGNTLRKAVIPEEGDIYLGKGDIKRAQKVGDAFSLAETCVVNRLTGQPMEKFPSAFDKPPTFEEITPEEAALFETTGVYHLPHAQIPAGKAYLGTFNYRASYDNKDALLISNAMGVFLLIGNLKKPTFLGIDADSQLLIAEEETQSAEDTEESGDFGSLF